MSAPLTTASARRLRSSIRGIAELLSLATVVGSERRVGPRNRPPHVRDRGVVVAEPFFRLLEMTPDDVDERIDRDDGIRIEGVEIVDRHEARLHVPFVLAHHL